MNSNRLLDVTLFQAVGLLVAAAVLATSYAATPPEVIDRRIQLAIGVFLSTIILWIAKPVPYLVSSLFSLVLLYALGLVDSMSEATVGFASNLVFFFVILLLIGKSVAKVGLDDWVANRLVSTTSTPRVSVRRLAVTILLLALLMPSALARTVTFMPVIDRINDVYRLDDDSHLRRFGYYTIGHANPVASLALMTGGGMPIVTSEMINSMVRPLTWVEWALYMTPPIVLLYSASVVGAGLVYRRRSGEPTNRAAPANGDGSGSSSEEGVEPLAFDQKVVVTVLALAIVSWIVGSFVGVPAIIPAMFVVFAFSLPWFRIITTKEIRDLSWGVVFLIGTMLSLLEVMQTLDAFDFVIDVLFSKAPVLRSGLATLFILFLFAVAIRGTFSSVSAALLLLLPILLEFASILGLNRLYVSLSLAIILGSAVFLPFNVPTVLVAYERGPLSLKEVLSLGMMTLGFAFLVVAFNWVVYWPFLERITG